MAKFIHLGSAGPDDPIYKEGVTMYAKPSFPQQESSPESKAGTPTSQQLPSKTQVKDTPQDEEEMKVYEAMQDKMDQYLIEIGAVSPQPTDKLEKEPSATSEDTTPSRPESR